MTPMSGIPCGRRFRDGAWRWTAGLAGVLAILLSPGTAQIGAQSGIVQRTRAAIADRDLRGAEQMAVRALRQSPSDAEALLALSWVGRGALAAQQLDLALRVAQDTETRILSVLHLRPLDAEPQVPLALGAAYEVQAQALAGLGARSEALILLNRALVRYGKTSIQARLQKNVHLLSLRGQPMPSLVTEEHLTDVRLTPAATLGKPLLLFFWAHWCADSFTAAAPSRVGGGGADAALRVHRRPRQRACGGGTPPHRDDPGGVLSVAGLCPDSPQPSQLLRLRREHDTDAGVGGPQGPCPDLPSRRHDRYRASPSAFGSGEAVMRSLRLFAKGFMSARAYGCVGDPAVFERGVLHKPGQATPDAGPDAPRDHRLRRRLPARRVARPQRHRCPTTSASTSIRARPARPA